MKKLYTLAVALSVVVSAHAAAPKTATKAEISPIQVSLEQSHESESPTVLNHRKAAAQEWVSLGMTEYTDGFLTSYHTPEVSTWEVEIMESSATPGYYRLVAPYAHLTADGKCNDLYIHAEKAGKVYISTQDMGFDLGDGNITFGSQAGYYKEAGYDDYIDDSQWGTSNGKSITFPQNSLFIKQGNSSMYTSNDKGQFKVVIPEPKPEWISLGQAVYTDAFLTSFHEPDIATWNVEIMESTSTPGYFKLVAPYAHLAADGKCNDLYIHAEDGKRVYISTQNMGFDLGDGNITVGSQAGYYKENGGDNAFIEEYGLFGSYDGHIITFPVQTLWISQANYKNGNMYSANLDGRFRVTMPTQASDCELNIISDQCAPDQKYSFSVEAAGEYDKILYGCFFGRFEASPDLFTQAAKISTDEVDCGPRYTQGLTKTGVYTAIAVALDANEKVLAGATKQFFSIEVNKGNWEVLGTGKYTEDIIASIYNGHSNDTYDIVIERNTDTEGIYRIVDPYNTTGWSMYDPLSVCGAHKHYIVIDASDPEKVTIAESPIGVDYGDGMMSVISHARYFIEYEGYEADNPLLDQYYGKLDDSTITFPTNSILFYELNLPDTYQANKNGMFTLELPKSSKVIDIETAENGKAEYYNLQGVKVDKPSSGIYIKRHNGKATKVLVK